MKPRENGSDIQERGFFSKYVENLHKICTLTDTKFEWGVRRARRKEAKLYEKETTGEKH